MMGAALAEDRRAWGSVPIEVHRAAMEEYERTGVIPSANVLARITGVGRMAVTRALKQLLDEGLIAQPHGDRNPYVPLIRPDGTRVRPVLVEVTGDGVEPGEVKDPLREASTVELAEELARRAREGQAKK